MVDDTGEMWLPSSPDEELPISTTCAFNDGTGNFDLLTAVPFFGAPDVDGLGEVSESDAAFDGLGILEKKLVILLLFFIFKTFCYLF